MTGVDVEALRVLLAKADELVRAAKGYASAYQHFGGSSMESGRQWDLMRRARIDTANAVVAARVSLPTLLAKTAEYEALVAELATERDLHNRIARNFDHYSKEWEALKAQIEAAPIGTVVAGRANSYGGYHVEIAHDQGWASGQRVRLLLVREGGE